MTLRVFAIFCVVYVAGCSLVSPHMRPVVWRDSRQYRKCVAGFRLDEAESYRILVHAVQGRKGVYVDQRPMFICGTEYGFVDPEKTRIPVCGYYVDGMTGKVTYRKSQKYFKVGDKTLPANPFEAEEPLSQR